MKVTCYVTSLHFWTKCNSLYSYSLLQEVSNELLSNTEFAGPTHRLQTSACYIPCPRKICHFYFLYSCRIHAISVRSIFDHPRSGVVYNFGRVCLSVCMYVCQTITFESIDVGSSYLHVRHISTHHGSSSNMKVIGSRSRSQEPKRSKISIPVMQNFDRQ